MTRRSRIRRARDAAADWLVAGTDLATAVWRRVRPGLPVVGEVEAGCEQVPIVVLPGILEPWTYLAPMGNWFTSRGHPVHYVETLGWNLADVARSAERCRELLHERGVDRAVIVAHSKGGLIGKAALALETAASPSPSADVVPSPDGRAGHESPVAGPHPQIAGMVTIATPFAGSTLGGRFQRLPGLRRTPLGMFLPGSTQLVSLAAERAVNERIVSLAPAWDQVIPEGSHLEGALNVRLDVPGHFRPVRDEGVWRTIHEHVHLLAGVPLN